VKIISLKSPDLKAFHESLKIKVLFKKPFSSCFEQETLRIEKFSKTRKNFIALGEFFKRRRSEARMKIQIREEA
jgi:hypothetical protein